MLSLVIGGAASGKSGFAEDLLMRSAADERIYVATLSPSDDESRDRIKRHQEARSGKGFSAWECFDSLEPLFPLVTQKSAVLVESLGTLFANRATWDKPETLPETARSISQEVLCLCECAGEVVVVTDEIAGDGRSYDETTEIYRQVLGEMNRKIATAADQVIEVTCGLPLFFKGGDAR